MFLLNGAVGLTLIHGARIVSVVQFCTVVLDDERFIGDAVEKIAVMGNDHDAFFVGNQETFQPRQRFDIQVVGRLVQHQNVRLAGELNGKRQTGFLPAAERPDILVHQRLVKAEFRQD